MKTKESLSAPLVAALAACATPQAQVRYLDLGMGAEEPLEPARGEEFCTELGRNPRFQDGPPTQPGQENFLPIGVPADPAAEKPYFTVVRGTALQQGDEDIGIECSYRVQAELQSTDNMSAVNVADAVEIEARRRVASGPIADKTPIGVEVRIRNRLNSMLDRDLEDHGGDGGSESPKFDGDVDLVRIPLPETNYMWLHIPRDASPRYYLRAAFNNRYRAVIEEASRRLKRGELSPAQRYQANR